MARAKIMVSIPEEMVADLDQAAKQEHRSRSEFVREAVRLYIRVIKAHSSATRASMHGRCSSSGPGGDDVLNQGGDLLDQATTSGMDDPAVGRDLFQFQQGLVDRALARAHGRLSRRTRCKDEIPCQSVNTTKKRCFQTKLPLRHGVFVSFPSSSALPRIRDIGWCRR